MTQSLRVHEGEFITQLGALLDSPVQGLDAEAKARIIFAAAERLQSNAAGAQCRLLPFIPGWRPTDEALHPGLGSSDQAALLLGEAPAIAERNQAFLLCDVTAGDGRSPTLEVSLSFTGADGSLVCAPVPGWERRVIPFMKFAGGSDGHTELREIAPPSSESQRVVIALSPEIDLWPGKTWSWKDLDQQLRENATDGEDPYTFGHLFAQEVRVEVRITDGEIPVAADHIALFTCDTRRLGSLYGRLIGGLLGPDSARQAVAMGVPDPGPSFHPWYPVLRIGSEKASLYARALKGDIVDKRRNLTDPGWLLRLGIHLEFLTYLGVVEAVKDDVGDLLTPEERSVFEQSPLFEEVRQRISPERWREVWDLRAIAFRGRGVPRAGPVSARNLLCKRRATLAFLEAHHEDLRHAIELAGPNHHNAQETWQRVFRDAERAVLGTTSEAFPELEYLPDHVREFVLWHRRGQVSLEHSLRVPGHITSLFGDQDGLFGSACAKYRESMNSVAGWAKQRALMDYTGRECIPREVSLLETKIARPAQVHVLQRRDGYLENLGVELPDRFERSVEQVERLLREVPAFAMLTEDELGELARTARPILLGPLERLVVQGQEGSSLFVVLDGVVEVMLRREDGQDWPVDTMARGAVVGEMSLLTGEPRAATVRAIDGATVYEIGRHQYEPVVRSRPQLLDELAALVEQRLQARSRRLSAYDAERERKALRDRIADFLLRAQPDGWADSAVPAN